MDKLKLFLSAISGFCILTFMILMIPTGITFGCLVAFKIGYTIFEFGAITMIACFVIANISNMLNLKIGN